ncbi:MAG: bifunctional heptose 7-phosphate kinase/heptose 1-phosphate adenyltransferase [Longimicrobiales bacterium]
MNKARFDAIVGGAARHRIVVLGDVMLDRYVEGAVDRISPEAPVPVVHVHTEWDAVGGAANVAANVRALGAECDLIGVVADDAAGRRVLDALDEMGVRHRFVQDGSRPTTAKTRVLARSQQVVRVDREQGGAVGEEALAALKERADVALLDADCLILEDYNKGALTPALIRHVLDRANEAGVPAVVDPKWEHFFAYRGATVFKPNRKELEGAVGEPARPDDVEWMESVRDRLGCTHLLVTLGAEGMALASPGPQLQHSRAAARAVYDVSGAGDTVSAAFSLALVGGATPGEAMVFATHAAAVGVGKAGVATVAPDEVWRSIVQGQGTDSVGG